MKYTIFKYSHVPFGFLVLLFSQYCASTYFFELPSICFYIGIMTGCIIMLYSAWCGTQAAKLDFENRVDVTRDLLRKIQNDIVLEDDKKMH